MLLQQGIDGVSGATFVTALFGLLGTIVGGSISFGATWWVEHKKQIREQRERAREFEAIAKAIAAEVETGIRMFRFRKARESVEYLWQEAQKGNLRVMHMQIGEHNLALTRSSLSKIGHLAGDIPPLVAEIITLVNSVKLDLDRFNGMSAWTGSQADLMHLYEQLRVIIDRAFDLRWKNVANQAVSSVGILAWSHARRTDAGGW